MALVGKIDVLIQAKTKAFQKGMKKARYRLRKFSQNVKRMAGTMLKFGGAIAGVTTGIGMMVKQQLNAMDATAKLARSIGIGTEELLRLQHAAKLSGVSVEQFNMGLLRMSRRVGEAAGGTGEAKQALEDLGLSAKELARKGPTKTIEELADAIQGLDTEAERVAAIADIFGRSGAKMMVLFEDGSEGLRNMMDRLAESRTYTMEQAKAAEELNDRLTDLGEAIKGEFTEAVVGLLGPLEDVTAELLKIDAPDTNVFEEFFDVVGSGFIAINEHMRDFAVGQIAVAGAIEYNLNKGKEYYSGWEPLTALAGPIPALYAGIKRWWGGGDGQTSDRGQAILDATAEQIAEYEETPTWRERLEKRRKEREKREKSLLKIREEGEGLAELFDLEVAENVIAAAKKKERGRLPKPQIADVTGAGSGESGWKKPSLQTRWGRGGAPLPPPQIGDTVQGGIRRTFAQFGVLGKGMNLAAMTVGGKSVDAQILSENKKQTKQLERLNQGGGLE